MNLKKATQLWTDTHYRVKIDVVDALETNNEMIDLYWGISRSARQHIPLTDDALHLYMPDVIRFVNDGISRAIQPETRPDVLELIMRIDTGFSIGAAYLNDLAFVYSVASGKEGKLQAFIACIVPDEFHSYREERKPTPLM